MVGWLDKYKAIAKRSGLLDLAGSEKLGIRARVLYCKDTVFRHLKNLVELGILERREAKRWCTDKAWEYRIVPEKLAQYVDFDENQTVDIKKSDH